MRIDQTKYIEYLEREVVRLTLENNKRLDLDPAIIHENIILGQYEPIHYVLPKKASITFKPYADVCKDAVILNWGDYNQTLYMHLELKYSMDAMHHLIDKFFYDLCRNKVYELKKSKEI